MLSIVEIGKDVTIFCMQSDLEGPDLSVNILFNSYNKAGCNVTEQCGNCEQVKSVIQ